jgi:hypothetical protein
MAIEIPLEITEWASGTNYAAGPDTGTPTKVDPASAVNGYIRNVVAAPQHVNFELNRIDVAHNGNVLATQRVLEVSALHFRLLDLTTDDTIDAMGATLQDVAAPFDAVVLVKVDSTGIFQAYDGPEVDQGGVVASITSVVREAATNGSRIVAIGTGGSLSCRSDNAGGSWSAGSAGIGGAVQYLVYMPANALSGGGDQFLCAGSGTGSAYRSDDDVTVWDALASTFSAVRGLAVLGGATANAGYCVALGNSGIQPRMSVLTDGAGGADFTGTQTPPNAATAEEPGSIVGCPQASKNSDKVYHVMRCNAGARLRTNSADDGFTWTAATTIEAPTGCTFSAAAPRIMACQSTGLLVIAALLSNGTTALYVSTDFATWLGPTLVRSVGVAAFAVAGGKVFYADGAKIFASDGLGRD